MADDIVQILLQAKDKASNVIKKASTGLRDMEKASKQTNASMKSLAAASKKASSGMKNLSAASKQTNASLKSLAATGKTLMASLMPVAGVAAFVMGAKKMISVAADFEAALANVSTLIDTTKVSMKGFGKALLEMSPRVNKSAKDLADGLYQVISSGVDVSEALIVLEASAKAAKAGLTTTEQAVLAITKALNIYNLEASDAEHVSDLLFKTVEKGQTTFPQLATQIGRVLPFAKNLGVTMEDALAVFAGMTTILGTTEQAATALEATFRAFITSGQKFRDAGIDINKVLAEEGMVGALKALKKLTGGNAEELRKLGIETEALRGVLGLFGGKLDDVEKNLKGMQSASGATAKAFDKQMGTAKSAGEAFTIALEAISIEINEELLPAIKELSKELVPLTRKIIKIIQADRALRALKAGDLDRIKKSWDDLTGKTRELAKAEDSLAKKRKELGKEFESINRQLIQLQIERSKVINKAAEENIKTITDEMKALEQQKSALEGALKSIEQAIKSHDAAIQKHQKNIAGITAITEDYILQIKRRAMTEDELKASKIDEYYERIDKAQELLEAGAFDLAKAEAQKAQQIAVSLKDQQEAIRKVEAAGESLLEIEEKMMRKEEEALKTNIKKSKEIKQNIKEITAQIKDYKNKVTELKEELNTLAKTRTVTQIDADIGEAKSKIAQIQGMLDDLKDKEVKITVKEESVTAKRFGGLIAGLARGGKLLGWGGGDRVRAMLEAGEYVIRKEAVSKYGANLFHMLNNLKMPAFSLPEFSVPAAPKFTFATGGPVTGGGNTVRLELKLGDTIIQTTTSQLMIDRLNKELKRKKMVGIQ